MKSIGRGLVKRFNRGRENKDPHGALEALEWRLHHRGTDSENTITRRLLGAGAEMAHAPEFEYVIINEDFDIALSQIRAIVIASRLAYKHQAIRHREQFISLGIPL